MPRRSPPPGEMQGLAAAQVVNLDQGTGSLYPFFDSGTSMPLALEPISLADLRLYVAGKGDSTVKYFEVVNTEPFFHYIESFQSRVPQKGFDFLPKRCVDVGVHEVMRGLKLESSSVQPVSFRVPRKSEAFQAGGPSGHR